MKELTPEQYQAVKEYAQGLKECFIFYKDNHLDSLIDIVLSSVLQIIDIHLELAELNLQGYGFNLKKTLDKE